MKRVISISILFVFLFFVFQWGFTFFKKEHNISYQVFVEDTIFDIQEIYQKEYSDSYDILITSGSDTYSYLIANQYNKQKKIIESLKYYKEGDSSCLYPVLENGEGTYLICLKDGKQYSEISFPNQNFVSTVRQDLENQGYSMTTSFNSNNSTTVGKSIVYSDGVLVNDIITLWNYKGIDMIQSKDSVVSNILDFDKYENSHGYLVGKYYVLPNYLSSKVLEFSSVTILDLVSKKQENIQLSDTLSSNTYINGVVDGKLYYTDPVNLLQMEINPIQKTSRLIGSKDFGGQLYQGTWEETNIYDFVTNHIIFQKQIPSSLTDNYSYQDILESNVNYYFTTSNGEVYRVSKNHLDNPVLLFQVKNLNNFKVIGNTIYFVADDTLYYFEEGKGIIPILKNNELRYNTINRVDIYRKS